MPYATRQSLIDFPKRKAIERKRRKSSTLPHESPKEKTPVKNASPASVSSSARKALHVCNFIVGREKEIERVTDFLNSHLRCQTSGSIYISGLPGTGKTACVNFVIEKNQFAKHFNIVKINCTTFNSSKVIFKRLCNELNLKSSAKSEKDAINSIENFLLKKHKMLLLILDEIDQLESKSQSVLYKIFEWPSWENSKFLLVGIANDMDLTNRNLPRLCARIELKPVLLHFDPYTKNEIAEILKNRLTDAGAGNLFAPGAIELIAAKVAGTSGDVRRALDLGKRVIEVAEQNQMQIQSTQHNLDSKEMNPKNKIDPLKECMQNIEVKSNYVKTPKKLDTLVNEILDCAKNPPKRKLDLTGVSPKKNIVNLSEASPRKLKRSDDSSRINFSRDKLGDAELEKFKESCENKYLRRSPRKLISLRENLKEQNVDAPNKVLNKNLDACIKSEEEGFIRRSPRKLNFSTNCETKAGLMVEDEGFIRRSPRKLNFDVNSKDVLTVVKSVFGSSKNFKPNEESSFPLHQKLLICSLLLMIKKGKKKDANIGKIHQVYSNVCSKRGLTAVDKSGFIYLCRQVEVTGIIKIGKGQGTRAKVDLQWDESEVTNSLKDLNLLSSILNDASCLT